MGRDWQKFSRLIGNRPLSMGLVRISETGFSSATTPNRTCSWRGSVNPYRQQVGRSQGNALIIGAGTRLLVARPAVFLPTLAWR